MRWPEKIIALLCHEVIHLYEHLFALEKHFYFREKTMLLKEISSGHMVEVLSIIDLINLNSDEVVGRYQEGEEAQDPKRIKKADLIFLSGEELPRCWTDPHYRDDDLKR